MTGMCQGTVDSTSSSRIDKTFGKSWNLRYVFNLVGQIHQPMHNIIRFSSSYPDGDDFGKKHTISIEGYKTLYDIFDDAFGQYRHLEYPLSSTTTLDGYVEDIMTAYPKSDFSKEVSNTDKSSWSKESYDIAKNFAYNASNDDYVDAGKRLVNKQLALAGYRLSNLVSYMMSKQEASPKKRRNSRKATKNVLKSE